MIAGSDGNPFPGLRPFREEEEYLFFGRENQVDAMVDKLATTRFLAVIGGSGCGKSSLVNCGLRPALHRGLMTSAGSAWRMAQFRPGGDPIGSMAQALARDGVLFPRDAAAQGLPLHHVVETTLRMSKLGLIDIVDQARLDPGINVLIVVDQFEELFRYRQLRSSAAQGSHPSTDEDALVLVNLLLEVIHHPQRAIYLVLTMRSDFLGDCTHFPGLAEAINAGQYLVPRLTRDERRAAIAGPVAVGGARMSPVLLTRLVNDVGDNPDQLSILQHALNRTWARWHRDGQPGRPLDLEHYESIGTMARALDQHAERAYAELGEGRPRYICEKLFRALTDTASDPRGVRRPTTMRALCELAGCDRAELAQVIDVFRKPSRSFLMPPADETLTDDTVVDISHESLMRVWGRLATWADEEAQAAASYRRLAETARLHAAGHASLWRDPELQLALDWWERTKPNTRWAEQYHPGFAAAVGFLQQSRDAREAEREAQAAQRQRELQVEQERAAARAQAARARMMRWATAIAVMLTVLALSAAAFAVMKTREATAARDAAIEAERLATQAREEAAQEAKTAQEALAKYEQVRLVLQREEPSNTVLALPGGAAGRPFVYIHVHNPEQERHAQRLRRLLPQRGYAAPGIETVTAGPRTTQLRYFRESEREEAERLTRILQESLETADIRTEFVGGYEARSRAGQFELWYGLPWFVIAGSFTEPANARRTQARLLGEGFDASLVDTSNYPNLEGSFTAVVLGPYQSAAAAAAPLEQVRRFVSDAYVKSGW